MPTLWFRSRQVVGVFFLGALAVAQVTTGTISGTVSDATGAVIPGATVRLKNVETGIQRSAVTDASGRYRVPELGLGNYEVTAEAAGFQSTVRTGITLTVGREAVVDFTLAVGAVTEKVEVTGEAPLVNATNATVSTLVDEGTLRDIPLNGRSFADLTSIQPGVISNLPLLVPAAQGVYNGGGPAARHSIGGTKPQQSTYLLDGIEITTPSEGMPVNSVLGQQLGVDGIREFSVLQSNYGAQFGRAVGGVINAVTQSGTNLWRGTVFEFFRNDALDARDFFTPRALTKAPLKRNQFGASLGGPLQKDRTFFFLNYEGLRQSSAVSFLGTSLTASTRQGRITDAQGQVAQTVAVDPNVVPLMNLLPLPNGGFRNNGVGDFFSNRPFDAAEDYGLARMDRQLSENDNLFGRITIDRSNRTDDINPLFPAGFFGFQVGGYVVGAISETHVFSPRVLNTARLGYTRRNDHLFYNYTQGGNQFPNAPGLDPRLSPARGIPVGLFAVPGVVMYATTPGAIGPSLNGPAVFVDNTFDYSDSLAINRGRHSIALGANLKRYQANELNEPWVYGQFSWQTIQTFLANQPFTTTQMLGFTTPGSQAADVYRGWRQTYGGFFVQDDFQFRPNLTVNLGLRWEGIRSPREVNGKLAQLKNIFQDSQFTLLNSEAPLFGITDGLHGLSPRVGFAWSVLPKTVFRGGFGAFEEVPLEYVYQLALEAPPFAKRFTVNTPNLKFPFPFGDSNLVSGSGEPLFLPLDVKMPYTLQWTASLERQLGQTYVVRANYLGLRGINIFTVYNPNQPQTQVVNGRQFTPAGVSAPNPNFTSYRYVAPISDQIYNAFQLVVEKRFSDGLRFNGSYNFARNIDNGGGAGIKGAENVNAGGFAISNGLDHGADRGLSTLHIQHNFIVSATYELPVGSGRRWGSHWSSAPNYLLGGWTVNAVSSVRTGLPVPISMIQRQDRCSAQTCVERPDLRPGGNNNPVLPNWTPERYFDASQFVLQPLGFFGNLGRNTVIGPGLWNLDLSFSKLTRLRETKSLELRAELFNLFNHPNFALPNGNTFLNAAGALDANSGRITATATTMRQIQFGLKLKF